MLAFWAPPTPSRKPRKSWKWWKRPEAWVCSTRRAFSSDRPESRSRRAQPCPASRSLARTLREFCALSSLSAPSVAPSLMDRVRALVRVLARRAELAARVPFLACIASPGTSCSNTWLTSVQNSMRPLQAYRSLGDWPVATGCCESGCHLGRPALRPPQERAGPPAPSSAGAGTPSPCALICSRRAWPSGSTSSGASTPQRTSTSSVSSRSCSAWSTVGPRARSTTPSWPSTASWVCSLET